MKVGIDIEENKRFLNYAGDDKKLSKIFTDKEIEYFGNYSSNLEEHIAGTFCAKEAVAKALKVGFGEKLNCKDVEILHTKTKVPYVNTNNKKLQSLLKNKKIDISISHTDEMSSAICVIED